MPRLCVPAFGHKTPVRVDRGPPRDCVAAAPYTLNLTWAYSIRCKPHPRARFARAHVCRISYTHQTATLTNQNHARSSTRLDILLM